MDCYYIWGREEGKLHPTGGPGRIFAHSLDTWNEGPLLLVPMKPEPPGCLRLQLCLRVFLEAPCFLPVAIAVMGTTQHPSGLGPSSWCQVGWRQHSEEEEKAKEGSCPQGGQEVFGKPQLKGRIGSLIC